MAHLSTVDWCQDLIAPLSPIALLSRKLMWLIPRCIWLHLPGTAMSSPSSHPFSKLLFLLGSLRTTTGLNRNRQTHTHASSGPTVHLDSQTWSHGTQPKSILIGITIRAGNEWMCPLVLSASPHNLHIPHPHFWFFHFISHCFSLISPSVFTNEHMGRCSYLESMCLRV